MKIAEYEFKYDSFFDTYRGPAGDVCSKGVRDEFPSIKPPVKKIWVCLHTVPHQDRVAITTDDLTPFGENPTWKCLRSNGWRELVYANVSDTLNQLRKETGHDTFYAEVWYET